MPVQNGHLFVTFKRLRRGSAFPYTAPMIKCLLSCLFAITVLGLAVVPCRAENSVAWQGTVTAVNSNGNTPGHAFTAVDAEGRVKFFTISTLEHLELNDRVQLHYIPSEKFPLEVTRIRFLQPEK